MKPQNDKIKFKPTPVACIGLILLLLVQLNCFWVKAKYDPEGHQNAVTLQQQALVLMAKAGESFYKYREQVHNLMSKVEAAYDHARMIGKNDAVTGIWNVLRDPRSNRLGYFMAEWEAEGIMTEKKISTYKKWIEDDFKLLTELEEKKKK